MLSAKATFLIVFSGTTLAGPSLCFIVAVVRLIGYRQCTEIDRCLSYARLHYRRRDHSLDSVGASIGHAGIQRRITFKLSRVASVIATVMRHAAVREIGYSPKRIWNPLARIISTFWLPSSESHWWNESTRFGGYHSSVLPT